MTAKADPADVEAAAQASEFACLFSGRLYGVVSWEQLDAFWKSIDKAAGWYLYAVGEPPPEAPSEEAQVAAFIERVDALLRKEHREDYCGIVYADDLADPRLVKIYDPNHLGASCGASSHAVLPGWVLSRVPPEDLKPKFMPENRRRWWRELFGRH